MGCLTRFCLAIRGSNPCPFISSSGGLKAVQIVHYHYLKLAIYGRLQVRRVLVSKINETDPHRNVYSAWPANLSCTTFLKPTTLFLAVTGKLEKQVCGNDRTLNL